MVTYNKIVELFEKANENFLEQDRSLFTDKVAERTLCGALMLHINTIMREDAAFDGYYVDVEYNRNRGAIKTMVKTVLLTAMQVIRINCDLIVHSRGGIAEQDNLIALEMKKSNVQVRKKNEDRERLKALTKDSFDDIWSFDGRSLPEHVCRYLLGIYYEIDYKKREIKIEYYYKGEIKRAYPLDISYIFNCGMGQT